MQKAKLSIENLSRKFSSILGKHAPELVWKAPEEGKGEKFIISYQRGIVKIEGESLLAVAYGISQALLGLQSGHIAEYLGERIPRFPLRPLWVGGNSHVKLTDNLGVSVPSFFSNLDFSELDRFCQRVIELGFNAILLGSREYAAATEFQLSSIDFNTLFSFFHEYGIKVLLKPMLIDQDLKRISAGCPLNPSDREKLQSYLKELQTFKHLDYLFWESSYLFPDFVTHPGARDAILSEVVLEEVRVIEEVLSIPLIYYLPVPNFLFAKEQASWMLRFCDDVGEKTTIAFSSVAGNACLDHLPPHPFWEYLRQSTEISSTRLLPIVNVGSVLQGEGLWPAPSLDLLDNYYSRLYRHSFAGAIALVNTLPKEGGLLDCALWTASQCLWKESSPLLLAETWFQVYRSEWDFSLYWDCLKKTREMIIELSLLRSLTNEMSRDLISTEECRAVTESLLSRLKILQMKADKLQRQNSKKTKLISLTDYLTFFARDAQRIILYFLQCFNLSYPHLFNEDDLQDSFWTQFLSKSGHGVRSAAKVVFLEEPSRGNPGSKMETIFLESRQI